jgi:hypothetical protein
MKKINLILSIAVVGVIFITSCKKEVKCEAGTGGSLTVVAYLEHHGVRIPNDSAYLDSVHVKFNTQDSPGNNPSFYDAHFVGEEGEDHVHVTGLKCGDYFFYATGYDKSISKRVFGGIKFSSDQSSGEVILHIPVSE